MKLRELNDSVCRCRARVVRTKRVRQLPAQTRGTKSAPTVRIPRVKNPSARQVFCTRQIHSDARIARRADARAWVAGTAPTLECWCLARLDLALRRALPRVSRPGPASGPFSSASAAQIISRGAAVRVSAHKSRLCALLDRAAARFPYCG